MSWTNVTCPPGLPAYGTGWDWGEQAPMGAKCKEPRPCQRRTWTCRTPREGISLNVSSQVLCLPPPALSICCAILQPCFLFFHLAFHNVSSYARLLPSASPCICKLHEDKLCVSLVPSPLSSGPSSVPDTEEMLPRGLWDGWMANGWTDGRMDRQVDEEF